MGHGHRAGLAGRRALHLTADFAAAEREMRAILDARDFVRRALRRHAAHAELAYPAVIAGNALGAVARIAGLPAVGPAGQVGLMPSAPDKAEAIVNRGELQALEAWIQAGRGGLPGPILFTLPVIRHRQGLVASARGTRTHTKAAETLAGMKCAGWCRGCAQTKDSYRATRKAGPV